MVEDNEVVNFTNIDTEDFVGKYTGQETIIKARQTKLLPGYLAKHFSKHLIDKILLKEGKTWTDEGFRKPLEKSILGEVTTAPEIEPIPELVEVSDIRQTEPEFSELPKETERKSKRQKK